MRSSAIVTLLLSCIPQLSLGNVRGTDRVLSGCGDSLSETYLSKIREVNINLFAPSAYFRGKSTKFISSDGVTELNTDKLCVDGAGSYTGPIQLYDDGSHGDDVAYDGVYTRDCVHYCDDKVDLNDYFGYAMLLSHVYSRLVVVNESLEGTVPYEVLSSPLTPDATVIASSHAVFFADVNRSYYPNYPMSASPNAIDWPSGKSVSISALLSIFGDAFDFLTVTTLEKEHVGAIGGAGMYKWQHWDRRGGPMINNIVGEVDKCFMAVSGVPTYRLNGVVLNGDVVDDTNGENHELVHGVSGFSYHMKLQKARNGDNTHTPAACTDDHSSLQGPLWDWVLGFPNKVPTSDQTNRMGVRLEANDDCKQCDDDELESCCTFRYHDVPNTKDTLLANPELGIMSPLMLYIAGMIKADEVPGDKKTYYCMGSDTDGGCGKADNAKESDSVLANKYWRAHYSNMLNTTMTLQNNPECNYTVDDSDRSRITSDDVTRFTLDELIDANGGTLQSGDEDYFIQEGNCGYNCTAGIKPDVNGIVHPEVFLDINGYYTNGEQYAYNKGPLNVQGTNKNMFDRCMDSCVKEQPKQKFLYKIRADDTFQRKSCAWLSARPLKTRKKVCTGNAYNLSQRGYKSARISCPDTCVEFL